MEKKCEHCRYYSQHYIKRNIEFVKVECGHCCNSNIKMSKRLQLNCGFWEDVAIKIEERKKTIKEVLTDFSARINEIAIILKDDLE